MAIELVTATLADDTEELTEESTDVYTGELTAPDTESAGNQIVSVTAYDDSGNVATAVTTVTVTLWHTPKTNWVSTDRFNIEDYNRIKNNLVYLHELAESLCKPFDISDMGDDIEEYTPYWSVEVFNMFETNLDLINENIFTQDFGYAQTFYNNGIFIKWDELNRIESAILSMNDVLERQSQSLRRLDFRLGTFKEVKI